MVENRIKVFVGTFNAKQLKKGIDKIAIDKKKKETGLKYINNQIVTKKGTTLMKVWVSNDFEL